MPTFRVTAPAPLPPHTTDAVVTVPLAAGAGVGGGLPPGLTRLKLAVETLAPTHPILLASLAYAVPCLHRLEVNAPHAVDLGVLAQRGAPRLVSAWFRPADPASGVRAVGGLAGGCAPALTKPALVGEVPLDLARLARELGACPRLGRLYLDAPVIVTANPTAVAAALRAALPPGRVIARRAVSVSEEAAAALALFGEAG